MYIDVELVCRNVLRESFVTGMGSEVLVTLIRMDAAKMSTRGLCMNNMTLNC